MKKVFHVNACAQGVKIWCGLNKQKVKGYVMETVDDAVRVFKQSAWYRRRPQPPSAAAIMRKRLQDVLKLNLMVFMSRLQKHALDIELRQSGRQLLRFSEHELLCDTMISASQMDTGSMLCVRRVIWSIEQLASAVFGWSFNAINGVNGIQEAWLAQHHNRAFKEFQLKLIPGLRALCTQLFGADADLWFSSVDLQPLPVVARTRKSARKAPLRRE